MDTNLFWKRQVCPITLAAIFVKLDTPHIAIFSTVVSDRSTACPLLFLGILEANLVVTEMFLSLVTSHSERTIHLSLNVILTLFWDL